MLFSILLPLMCGADIAHRVCLVPADKLDALREKREESQTRRDRGQKLVSGLESESKRIVLEIEKVRREEVNDAGKSHFLPQCGACSVES